MSGSTIKPTRAYMKTAFEASFQDAVDKLQQAINEARPDMTNDYSKVSVLAVQWSNDNMGISGLAANLMEVFSQKYRFKTQTYTIPAHDSNQQVRTSSQVTRLLDTELQTWIRKEESEQSLLILYYSGHAESPPPHSQLLLSGDMHNPKIDWQGLRGGFGNALGSKLLLLGCCNAAMGAVGLGTTMEMFCASAFDAVASQSLVHSFTNRLISILNAEPTPSISIASLNANMVDEALVNRLDATPWHGATQGMPSITLKPLRPKEVVWAKSASTQSKGRVLISVSFSGVDSAPNYNSFKIWLTKNIPEEVAQIKVEAVFDSNSHIFLLTMPVEVWTMLPEHESWNFVSFVFSRNRLLVEAEQNAAAAWKRTTSFRSISPAREIKEWKE